MVLFIVWLLMTSSSFYHANPILSNRATKFILVMYTLCFHFHTNNSFKLCAAKLYTLGRQMNLRYKDKKIRFVATYVISFIQCILWTAYWGIYIFQGWNICDGRVDLIQSGLLGALSRVRMCVWGREREWFMQVFTHQISPFIWILCFFMNICQQPSRDEADILSHTHPLNFSHPASVRTGERHSQKKKDKLHMAKRKSGL